MPAFTRPGLSGCQDALDTAAGWAAGLGGFGRAAGPRDETVGETVAGQTVREE
jgi:hypothetical protein